MSIENINLWKVKSNKGRKLKNWVGQSAGVVFRGAVLQMVGDGLFT